MADETKMILDCMGSMAKDTKIVLERLDKLDSRMDTIESKVDTIESKVGTIESKVDTMESKMDTMESKMDTMESKMDIMESKMDTMESNMDDMKSQISGINLILENEIRRNIQIIAEGHLDLSRKLDDAIKVKEEREMLLVRTNVLESEVKMIKGKVDALCSVS